jgi:hypothetical protein
MSTVQKTRPPRTKKPLPPLENGDHLDQKTFHNRYEAMPDARAELIGGIVYMASPLKLDHGRHGIRVIRWLGEYEEATLGTEALENVTHILGPDSETQPDVALRIVPECGGQTSFDKRGYLTGGSELITEISHSTESIDLNAKKDDYERAGVLEYVVVALRTKKVFWFVRKHGKLKEVPPDADGIYRSAVFPGLWLDPAALLRRDGPGVLTVVRRGLASPEHAAFVVKLASRR